MATAEHQADPSTPKADEQPSPTTRKPKRRRLLVAAVCLAVLIGLVPTLVSRTPLRQPVLRALCSPLNGRVDVADVSLGWTAPLVLRDVSVWVRNGERLLAVSSIASEKSLGQMLFSYPRIGGFRIERPEGDLVFRDGGSNLEDVLAPLFQREDRGPSRVSYSLAVVEGTIRFQDETGDAAGAATGISLRCDVSGDGRPPELEVSGTLIAKEERGTFELHAEASRDALETAGPDGPVSNRFKLDGVPLAALQPVLKRWMPSATATGELSCDLTWRRTPDAAGSLQGTVNASHLKATLPRWLGDDTLKLDHFDADARLGWTAQHLRLEDVSLNCDVGRFFAKQFVAALEMIRRRTGPNENAAELHDLPDGTLEGVIDLPALAAVLPRTLRLREDSVVTSGKIRFSASRPGDLKDSPWLAHVTVEDLAGRRGQQPVAWEQPIDVEVQLSHSSGGAAQVSVAGQSSFLSITGSGTTEAGDFTVDGDLGRLTEDLHQFIDPRAISLSGTLAARGEYKRLRDDAWQATSRMTLEQFQMRAAARELAEPAVRIETAAVWDHTVRQLRLDSTTLEAQSLSLRLANCSATWPQEQPAQFSGGVAVRGDLQRLWPLIGNFSHRVIAAADGPAKASLPDAPAVPAESERIRPVSFPAGIANSADPPGTRLAGVLTANIKLDHADHVTQAVWKATVDDFAVLTVNEGSHSRAVGRKMPLELSGRGRYDHRADQLVVDDSRLAADGLEITTRGTASDLGSRVRVDVSGELDYDLARLTEAYGELLGPDMELRGTSTQPYRLNGAIARNIQPPETPEDSLDDEPANSEAQQTPSLGGEASLAWESAKLYGLTIGPAALEARLEQQTVHFQPLDVALSEGRLQLSPRVELAHDRPLLIAEPGRVLDGVHFSPEMCRGWLKYAAPLMANATQIEGRFSADLKAASIPLSKPRAGAAAGTLEIDAARVGPGPLAQQILWIVRQVDALINRRPPQPAGDQVWLSMPQQSIAVELKDGRVHHSPCEMQAQNVVVRTYGSVGLDQSLDLVAEVPLREEWLGTRVKALNIRTVRVPIRGTLTQPQIDRRAFDAVARQLAGAAAGSLLNNLLKDQLDRLFRPER